MALKKRIIGKILIDPSGVAVKFKQFTEGRRVVGNPVSVAKVLQDQQIDELYLCFLGVADPRLVGEITETLMTPVTIAGSITRLDQVAELIRGCGAEKVVVKHPALGAQIADGFGSQAWAWPLDYHGDMVAADVPPGVGEVIATSIDRDGMGTGLDMNACAWPWPWPVVVSGGCGRLSHVKDALEAGADGVCIASQFAFTDKSAVKVKSWLASEGLAVRAIAR